jgi:hypothetical protein
LEILLKRKSLCRGNLPDNRSFMPGRREARLYRREGKEEAFLPGSSE